MAQDSNRITVAQKAFLYIAQIGTTAPVDVTTALAAGFKEVGYFTPDSLAFGDTPAFASASSHQANLPTKRWQTGGASDLNVDLQEWDAFNFQNIFGGGTLTVITPGSGSPPVGGVYKFSPPAIGTRGSAVCAIAHIEDGAKKYRLVIPTCSMTDAVTMKLAKTAESVLPFHLSVNQNDVGDPFYWLTNDPAFSSLTY